MSKYVEDIETEEDGPEQWKAMGIPDISQAEEVIKSLSSAAGMSRLIMDQHKYPQETLREMVENCAKFLISISPGKKPETVLNAITPDIVRTYLKVNYKYSNPENVSDMLIRKHLKTARKKLS